MPTRAEPVVSILSDRAPEFIAVRYGPGDPPAFKSDASGHGFAAYWAETFTQSGIVSWRPRPPALHASVFPPSGHAPPSGAVAAGRMFFTADSARFEASRAAALLIRVAETFRAIYGSAWVLDGYMHHRGMLLSGPDADDPDEPAGTNWIGLPPTPPWLAWYGEDYVRALGRDLAGASTGRGLLVGNPEQYAEPARYRSMEEAVADMRHLPFEYVASRSDPRFWRVRPMVQADFVPAIVRPVG